MVKIEKYFGSVVQDWNKVRLALSKAGFFEEGVPLILND